MADKGPGSTGRNTTKRLARAKVKPTDSGIKSSKGRAAAEEVKISEAEKKRARKQKITAIAIGVFAVIMALSMMLPSLTYIFGNNGQVEEEPVEETTTTDDATTTDEDSTEATGMDLVDSNYKAVVDPLEAKLADNPKDLATLLNLGNYYMQWATEASSYASDDASYEHLGDLYDKAIGYYDNYLELNDSAVVETNRAMCILYNGDTTTALDALKQVVADHPEYGPAWADLGLIYEYQGDTDAAKDAYQQAIDASPNDEYGASSYANRRLAAIASSEGANLTDETAETTSGNTESGAQSLQDILGAGI